MLNARRPLSAVLSHVPCCRKSSPLVGLLDHDSVGLTGIVRRLKFSYISRASWNNEPDLHNSYHLLSRTTHIVIDFPVNFIYANSVLFDQLTSITQYTVSHLSITKAIFPSGSSDTVETLIFKQRKSSLIFCPRLLCSRADLTAAV